MSQSLPMKPGIGYPPDGPVELQRKIVWNLYALYNAIAGGGGSVPIWVTVPASSSSAGSPGQIAYDGSYLYVCVSANTWRRTAIDDWS